MDSPGQSINTEQELRELYAALDERDRHIQDLEYELENGNSAEIYAIQQENSNLSAELEAQRDELIKCRDTVADLQIQVKQLRADNRELADSNEKLEEDANAHRSQVNTLRTQLAQHSKASEDVKRLKKDGNQQLHRLELENQRLRATIIEIEENEDILVNEIDTLVKEKSAYQESSEALSSKCDSLYAELDEKDRFNADLKVEKSKLQSDLETEKAAHATSESEWKKRDGDCRLEIAKLKEEIERERARHHSKEYESNKIELAKARKENQHLLSSFQQCIKDKNDAERDLDSAIQALNQSKANVKEEIAAVSRKERTVSAEIKRQLKKVEDREKSLVVRCADLEEQLQDVNNRLDKSEQRNSRYEENHGLTDAVRHQRKLEADLRRRDYDMKQLNHKLSLEIEHGRMLAKALELTRQHASSDFEIDDEELRAAVLRDDNILRSENEELTRQVEALEAERTKLLMSLRERAIEIGEKGTRFLGMSPDQIGLVMQFALNLKNGNTDLPLNDKSKELLEQIISLKSEREVDKVTIERLEREIFCIAESNFNTTQSENTAAVAVDAPNDLTETKCKESNAAAAAAANASEEVQVNTHSSPSKLSEKGTEMSGAELASIPLTVGLKVEHFSNSREDNQHQSIENDVPIASDKEKLVSLEANDLTSLAPHIQHFRRCSLLASKRNKELLDMVSHSERVISRLRKECSHEGKSPEVEVETSHVPHAVESNETRSEIMKRLLYLEKWKANAMTTIENQLKSLENTVSKSSYMEALHEIDDLRYANTLLADKVASAHISLLRYRDTAKSFGYSVDGNQEDPSSEVNKPLSSNAMPNERIKALSEENSNLWDRIVAYEEREHCLKNRMDNIVAECRKIETMYSGGMTSDQALQMQQENNVLKSDLAKARKSVAEYKEMVDLSASQTSALLSLKKGDAPEVVMPTIQATHFEMMQSTVELEEKLSKSQAHTFELQNTCKVLVLLLQRVIKSNWYHHASTYQVIFGRDSLELFANDAELKFETGLASSAAFKVKVLVDAIENLQKQATQTENALEKLAHEKDLLETRLSSYQGSEILSSSRHSHEDHSQQLVEAKTQLFVVQRDLRHSLHQQQILQAKNDVLTKSNTQLERDLAEAELVHVRGSDSKSNTIFAYLLSLQVVGDVDAEHEQTAAELKQVREVVSEYVDDLRDLHLKLSHVKVHRMEAARVSKQMTCLNEMVNEQRRVILVLKQKLTQAKQQDHIRSPRAQRYRHADDSLSSLGTIGSIGNLAKNSPKRGFLEIRLEEASKLIAAKDVELDNLRYKLVEAEETQQTLTLKLKEMAKETNFLKADISTLVSKFGDQEANVAELKNELHVQKRMQEETKTEFDGTRQENEQFKAKINTLAKERKTADAKIKSLEVDLERTKRILSVARQGRSRSEHNLKTEVDKAATAQEEATKLNKELTDMRSKLVAATEEKLAAAKRARVATSKLKSLKEKYDPEAHEKIKSELEKRVAVLNNTVSGLATQNSRLRAEVRATKEQESQQARTSNEPTKPTLRCNQCKSLEAHISQLKQTLLTEKKQGSENLALVEMYQKRSYTLEQALQNQSREESKYSSPRPPLSPADRHDDTKSEIFSITKENKELREKIRQMTIAQDKEAAKRSTLEADNKRMASQLEAFDLDFFEEIEDLKYKYNEAVRQLSELTNDG